MSRIAVVGSGISGMAVAYLLSRKHEVHLLEREDRLGGHTHTHTIPTSRGVSPIDTGFIVHNDRTYPNLVKLFRKLGVERQKSDMSFGRVMPEDRIRVQQPGPGRVCLRKKATGCACGTTDSCARSFASIAKPRKCWMIPPAQP